MHRLLSIVLAVVLAIGPSTLAQDQSAATTDLRRARPRIVAELSELLTHSSLATCQAGAGAAHHGQGRARVVSWNIRAARSAPVDAIAAELKVMEADLIALQEVDVRTRRGGFVEQPAALAAALGFHHVFAASIKWDEGDYGLALLSRWPLVEVQRHRLPVTDGLEPRIVLEVAVCHEGRMLRLFNHHADNRVASRHAGFAGMLGILGPHMGRGILVAGDFNEGADAPGVRGLLEAGLRDPGEKEDAGLVASGRIDFVLADAPLAAGLSKVRIWSTDKSDHPAVLTDLEW